MDITEFLQNIDNVVQKASQELHNLNLKYQNLLNKKSERYPIYFRGIGIKREQHICDSSKDVVVFGIKGKRLEFERKKGKSISFEFVHDSKNNRMIIREIVDEMASDAFDKRSGSSSNTTSDGTATVDDSSTTVVVTSSSSDDVNDVVNDTTDALNPSKW